MLRLFYGNISNSNAGLGGFSFNPVQFMDLDVGSDKHFSLKLISLAGGVQQKLEAGNKYQDYIYFLNTIPDKEYDLYYYKIDGYLVGVPNPIEEVTETNR